MINMKKLLILHNTFFNIILVLLTQQLLGLAKI